MKLVHAYLKHAENKRISKKQFPCLFPFSVLGFILVCVIPWFTVYSCLLFVSLSNLRPQCTCRNGCFACCCNLVSQSLVFLHTVKAQEAAAVFSWMISVATKTVPNFCKFKTVPPSPSVHLHVSELLYWNIIKMAIKNWHNLTLVFWTQLQLAMAQHARLQKESRGTRPVEAPQDCCASKNNLTVLSRIVRFPNAILVWVPLRAFAVTAMQLIF